MAGVCSKHKDIEPGCETCQAYIRVAGGTLMAPHTHLPVKGDTRGIYIFDADSNPYLEIRGVGALQRFNDDQMDAILKARSAWIVQQLNGVDQDPFPQLGILMEAGYVAVHYQGSKDGVNYFNARWKGQERKVQFFARKRYVAFENCKLVDFNLMCTPPKELEP